MQNCGITQSKETRAHSNSIANLNLSSKKGGDQFANINWSGSRSTEDHDEDVEDFEHYVQFKKEKNKDHFKKLNIIEYQENQALEADTFHSPEKKNKKRYDC